MQRLDVMTLHEVLARFWPEIINRPSGPLAFRFVLQPTMAVLLALRDGLRDAKTGQPPFLQTVLLKPHTRKVLLLQALRGTARLLALAATLDIAYQLIAFQAIRPVQTILIAVALGFVPYVLTRGPVSRVARRVRRGH